MTFDAALNLLWALMGVGALGALVIRDARRQAPLGARCRSALAVFIASVALFPCVSASDDLVRFDRLQVSLPATNPVASPLPEKRGPRPALYLARLLESLENFQISATCRFLITLYFLALVGAFSHRGVERPLPCPFGRSPPRFASLG